MKTKKYLSIVSIWRKTWNTKTKHLSISGCTTETDTINLAIDKAHQPSVKRALKLEAACSTTAPRREAKAILFEEISDILHKTSFSFDDYTAWAENVCGRIRTIYRRHGIDDYTYGNAQKLLSMTMKYILSSDNIDPTLPIFDVAFIPIDGVIMKIAKKQLHVAPMPTAWSKTDDFSQIVSYEKRIREAIPSGYSPFMWEIENWKN